jgi:hypothetical protein
VSSQVIQYKVIGHDSVQCRMPDGTVSSVSLHQELAGEPGYPPHPEVVQHILNTLGLDGWEAVTLGFPYVFRRNA